MGPLGPLSFVPPASAFIVNAFTERREGGNPAAVYLVDAWPSDDAMRRAAMSAGPSVTAFVIDGGGANFPLRWFTRGGKEVESFCGHATFAAGGVIAETHPALDEFVFEALSGSFAVKREEAGELSMASRAWGFRPEALPRAACEALGKSPAETYRSERDWILVYEDRDVIRSLAPDFAALRGFGDIAFIATAREDAAAFGFRFFCPGFSIGEDEDPATGSALNALAPFWATALGASLLDARQYSARGARFRCAAAGGRMTLRSSCTIVARPSQGPAG